jgi:hypothetical protein
MAIGAAIALAVGRAAAAEPTGASRELAAKLLDVMQVQRLMEEQFDIMRKAQNEAFQQLASGQEASPEATKRAQAMQSELMKLMKKELTWSSMKAEFVAAYAATFTDDELRGLIAFYESPVGRAFIAKTPELTERTTAISSARMQVIMPRVQELLMEYFKQGPKPGADDRS